MKDNEYCLQSSHNHDDRYFTETEINNTLKWSSEVTFGTVGFYKYNQY